MHSIPAFPYISPNRRQNNSDLFATAKRPDKAQHILCISLKGKEDIKHVISQHRLMRTKSYARRCIDNEKYPTWIRNEIQLCRNTNAVQPYAFVRELRNAPKSPPKWTTLWGGGTKWTYFAAGVQDKYDGQHVTNFITKWYKTHFRWQTYPTVSYKARNKMLSSEFNKEYCATEVLYIQSQGQKWKNTEDHSKIGISFDLTRKDKWFGRSKSKVEKGSNQYVCIGDMNRHYTQNERGGAFVCAQLPGLHSILYTWYMNSASCPNADATHFMSNDRRKSRRLH
eukprot:33843_1